LVTISLGFVQVGQLQGQCLFRECYKRSKVKRIRKSAMFCRFGKSICSSTKEGDRVGFRKWIPERMVQAFMALYVNYRTRVKTVGGILEEFYILVGVHQSSVLSPLYFFIIMDELSNEIRKGVPWELMFADDLALTEELELEVIEVFEVWKTAIELKGLKVNMEKTKIMVKSRDTESNQEDGHVAVVYRV